MDKAYSREFTYHYLVHLVGAIIVYFISNIFFNKFISNFSNEILRKYIYIGCLYTTTYTAD